MESVAMIGAFLGFLAALAPAAGGDAAAGAGGATSGAPAWLDELGSPWRAERLAARRRLLHLPPSALLELFDSRIDRAGARERAAFVAAGAARLAASGAAEEERDRWRERLASLARRERDPLVRERLVVAGARDARLYDALRALARRGALSPADETRLVEARVVRLLVETLHEGHIPGFFDGQFASVLEADESAPLRLARIAWDPRIVYVVRAMAVMALHESGDARLETFLRPLLVSPSFEYEWPENLFQLDRIGEREIRTYVACRLSQYARFSMAKAGIDEPIRRKIAYLEKRARGMLEQAKQLEGGTLRVQIEAGAMDTLFEAGYHYQQLDEYDEAEARYRRILEWPEFYLRVKKWAHYNLACIRAIQGRTDEALEELRAAFEAGFTDFSWARRDGDLASLHADPRFHELLNEFEFGAAQPAGGKGGR